MLFIEYVSSVVVIYLELHATVYRVCLSCGHYKP